jgi:hypothetical protein
VRLPGEGKCDQRSDPYSSREFHDLCSAVL